MMTEGIRVSIALLSRLSEMAYWVGTAKVVVWHCTHCYNCQVSKAPPCKPGPLQSVIASKTWELVAVDVLEVPRSVKGNQYPLVVYDYFSKWSFARAIPDQTAERIVQVMRDDVFTLVGPPCVSTQTSDRKLRVEYWVISAWLLG